MFVKHTSKPRIDLEDLGWLEIKESKDWVDRYKISDEKQKKNLVKKSAISLDFSFFSATKATKVAIKSKLNRTWLTNM